MLSGQFLELSKLISSGGSSDIDQKLDDIAANVDDIMGQGFTDKASLSSMASARPVETDVVTSGYTVHVRGYMNGDKLVPTEARMDASGYSSGNSYVNYTSNVPIKNGSYYSINAPSYDTRPFHLAFADGPQVLMEGNYTTGWIPLYSLVTALGIKAGAYHLIIGGENGNAKQGTVSGDTLTFNTATSVRPVSLLMHGIGEDYGTAVSTGTLAPGIGGSGYDVLAISATVARSIADAAYDIEWFAGKVQQVGKRIRCATSLAAVPAIVELHVTCNVETIKSVFGVTTVTGASSPYTWYAYLTYANEPVKFNLSTNGSRGNYVV